MSHETSDILEYMVWLVWSCLSLTPAALKNPIYAIVIATQDILQQLLSDSLLEFAPDLLDVLQASTPPSVSYFKRLPTDFDKHWGVYLLVLEKRGCRPRIYIGSGTHTARGLPARMYGYTSGTLIPRFVQQALDDGYRIVHKGLLCWCPIPTAGNGFKVRCLILAIETTFSFLLWAMKARTKTYGMPPLCPWSLEDIEYDGCCSHSALIEHIMNDSENLTLEQMAAKELEMEQRRVASQKATFQKLYWISSAMTLRRGKLFIGREEKRGKLVGSMYAISAT